MKSTETKSVLYLSIDGLTDPLGQSQVLPYLEGLTKKGYKISIISSEKPDRFEKNKAIITNICKRAQIDWHPIAYKQSPPVISALSNIKRMKKLAVTLHKQKKFSLIHCRSYIPMFTGVFLKKRFGLKLLFDIRGFWPDERVDGGLWKLSNPFWKAIYLFFKKKEKHFFEAADHIISLTDNAKREIHSWDIKGNPKPISIIPCCADLDHFSYHQLDEHKKTALMKSLNLNEQDFIITYLGSLGTFYAVKEMLLYFKQLKAENPNAKFLIMTASPNQIIWELAQELEIDKADIRITKLDRKDVPTGLSLGKYSLIFYQENFSRKACSPTKLGELMGLGIPSVCSPNIGDTSAIIEKTNAGITIKNFTDSSIKAAIQQMEVVMQTDKTHIRNGAKQVFNLSDGIEKYYSVYNLLLK